MAFSVLWELTFVFSAFSGVSFLCSAVKPIYNLDDFVLTVCSSIYFREATVLTFLHKLGRDPPNLTRSAS